MTMSLSVLLVPCKSFCLNSCQKQHLPQGQLVRNINCWLHVFINIHLHCAFDREKCYELRRSIIKETLTTRCFDSLMRTWSKRWGRKFPNIPTAAIQRELSICKSPEFDRLRKAIYLTPSHQKNMTGQASRQICHL